MPCSIGSGTKIFAFAHIMSGATIGKNCRIGDHVFIEDGVIIGDDCVIKNGCQIYKGTKIGSGCFIGPGVIFCNDRYPYSRESARGQLRYANDFWLEGVRVENNASVGAGCIILPGRRIMEYSLVPAGMVVTDGQDLNLRNRQGRIIVPGETANASGIRYWIQRIRRWFRR